MFTGDFFRYLSVYNPDGSEHITNRVSTVSLHFSTVYGDNFFLWGSIS